MSTGKISNAAESDQAEINSRLRSAIHPCSSVSSVVNTAFNSTEHSLQQLNAADTIMQQSKNAILQTAAIYDMRTPKITRLRRVTW